MAQKLYTEQYIADIATAIRSKSGGSDTYTVAQMAQAIANIPSGGGGTPTRLTPTYTDFTGGYIDRNSGNWASQSNPNNINDEYNVLNGHLYIIALDDNTGTRFAVSQYATDIGASPSTSKNCTKKINAGNDAVDPADYMWVSYTATADGYLVIQKDNAGVTGINTYVYDISDQDIVDWVTQQ